VEFGIYLIVAIVAYFVGSLPTGYLAGRARGLDIRTMGSGNIGATNVFRILGRKAGTCVLLIDALKGFLACWLLPLAARSFFAGANGEYLTLIAGVGAILGHNYTCWLRFKGGKGVATTGGVFFAVAPAAAGTALAVWLIVALISRYVSLASIAAAVTLPLAAWCWGKSLVVIMVFLVLGLLAIYKHKGNIQRLMNGTENRIGGRKPGGVK